MKRSNQRFFEEYNKTDKLCAERFGTARGISDYIEAMQGIADPRERGREPVSGWAADYKMLKHLRYIRNKLAHEAGAFSEALLEDGDLKALEDFHARLLKGRDPLTLYEKQRKRPVASQRTIARKPSGAAQSAMARRMGKPAAPKKPGPWLLIAALAIAAALWFVLH